MDIKNKSFIQTVVAHASNPSPGETESCGFLNWRPAWSRVSSSTSIAIQRNPVSKIPKQNQKQKQNTQKKENKNKNKTSFVNGSGKLKLPSTDDR